MGSKASASDVSFEAAQDGCGGVYFVEGKSGVFKPADEEFSALGDGHRKYIGAPREVAAYQLDQRSGGFSGVPSTTRVIATRARNTKWGSLQAYVTHIGSGEDFGASMMPVQDVHKIAVLDLRIFNTDRHFANILVNRQDGDVSLTPIDHGASLPSCLDLGRARFEWMQWKQSKAPMSKETLAHIGSLDLEADAECLRKVGIEEECILSMVLGTKVLQEGARRGLSLFDIGNAIQRDLGLEDEMSPLERAVVKIAGDSPTIAKISDDATSTMIAREAVCIVRGGQQKQQERTPSVTSVAQSSPQPHRAALLLLKLPCDAIQAAHVVGVFVSTLHATAGYPTGTLHYYTQLVMV